MKPFKPMKFVKFQKSSFIILNWSWQYLCKYHNWWASKWGCESFHRWAVTENLQQCRFCNDMCNDVNIQVFTTLLRWFTSTENQYINSANWPRYWPSTILYVSWTVLNILTRNWVRVSDITWWHSISAPGWKYVNQFVVFSNGPN